MSLRFNLPPRGKDVVPAVTDAPLVAACFPWRLQPAEDCLVVAVKASIAIAPGTEIAAIEPEPLSGDVPLSEEPCASLRRASDFAPFKPVADVTLVGHAYPNRAHRNAGQDQAAHVSLSFGALRQELAVIGDRTWHGQAPSAPLPFARMPLVWERAFGGAGDERNPLGRGLGALVLPNLEAPDRLIERPGDRPEPACFAPVPRTWPKRARLLGGYDAAWLAERWPYFPADFDWRYFNAAPAALQIPYPAGDEPFALAGVHPDHAVIAGRLPGLLPQAFALGVEAGFGPSALRPVRLRLDTVAFDADALRVDLVWRGHLEVSAAHAPELDRIFVASGRVGEKMTAPQAFERFCQRIVALVGPGAITEAPEPTARRDRPKGPPAAAMPPPALDRDAALALIASGQALAGADFAGCPLDGVDLRSRVLTGASFVGAKLTGARFDNADLRGAKLTRARADGASFKDCDLTAANLAESFLAGADFSGATLDHASFPDADARSARFERARLGYANAADAALDEACFDHAIAPGLVLAGAALARATFRGAKLDDAQLYDAGAKAACFEGASLQRARADDADLSQARFSTADATDASFKSAVLDHAQLDGSKLDGAVFAHARLLGARLDKCSAKSARFRRADLSDASALRANLMEASFEGARLDRADLRGANLYRAETLQANLHGARLDDAFTAGSKLAAK